MKAILKGHGFVYWAPRILSILFIIFLTMFSFDVISPDLSTGQILLNFVMHSIPSLVLLFVLIISWRYEIVGAVVFLLAGIAYTILTVFRSSVSLPMAISWSLTLAGPAILIGVLFWLNWSARKKR